MESFAATMAQPGYGFFMTLLIGRSPAGSPSA